MDKNVRIEIISTLQRGEVALWLGPSWIPPESPYERRLLGEQDWLGIWSEPQSAETASIFSACREKTDMRRCLVEVPGAIDDILQPDFRWADYCPFFYLNGRSPKADELRPAKRTLARLTKLEQFERLEHAVLAACGFSSPSEFVTTIKNSVGDFVGRLEHMIVLGVDDVGLWRSVLKSGAALSLECGILLVEENLTQVLREIEESRKPGAQAPFRHILARGENRIPLDALLRTDPPIDQFFHILTAEDIEAPSDSEDKSQLVRDLLANQHPIWRALAHRLEWQRPAYGLARERVIRTLGELERAKIDPGEVRCFDILGEPCSGLSVFLQWLAFHSAREGYPTILARETYEPVSYKVLRRFLVDLDRFFVEKGVPRLPVVIVLDDHVFSNDVSGQMATLSRLLRREARKVLLIRGVHKGNEQNVSAFEPSTEISSFLTDEEERSLQDWARGVSAFTGSAQHSAEIVASTIRDWQGGSQLVPLLVALDYVLTEDLRGAGDFTWHLEKRFIAALPDFAEEPDGLSTDSGHIVQTRDGPVSVTIHEESFRKAPPSITQLAEAIMTVSTMGRFGVAVPRPVLETMVEADTATAWQIMSILEQSRLMRAGITDADSRAMPRPYYDSTEALGLSHDLYANMLMTSLASGQLGIELDAATSALCKEFFDAINRTKPSDLLPLPLLSPLCKRLRPGDKDHVKYAEFLSMQYMRISYDDENSDRIRLLKQRVDELLSLYDAIPRAMIDDSVTLLHSLALNRRWRVPLKGYRLTTFDIADCRKTFDEASHDLSMAIHLSAERMESESLDNLDTSLGLVYRNRAIVEMNHPSGSRSEWAKYLGDAKQCFRDVLDRSTNAYAAHALADLNIRELEIHARRQGSPGYDDVPQDRLAWFPVVAPGVIAERLSETFILLSGEPDQKFAAVWNETKRRAFELLAAQEADEAIAQLKQQRDEMGYVLQALRHLKDFRVPEKPTEDEEQLSGMNSALRELETAQKHDITPCALGNLLRYALFSAQKERLPHRQDHDPAYGKRYELIRKLRRDDGSLCYNDPIWLYDYAMLAFQNGDVQEGQRMFAELRRANLFRQVPWERSAVWMEVRDSKRCVEGDLKIDKLDQRRDQGWGTLTTRRCRLRDMVPFKISSFIEFTPRGQVQAGKTVRCRIRLQPAGVYAIPQRA